MKSAKKGVGRPRVDAKPVLVKMPPDELADLDRWIKKQNDPAMTRPAALRRLAQRAMESAEESRPPVKRTAR